MHSILNRIDCFVSLSRGNRKVKQAILNPYSVSGHDDEVWDKIGQRIANLQALKCLIIGNGFDPYRNEDEDLPTPD